MPKESATIPEIITMPLSLAIKKLWGDNPTDYDVGNLAAAIKRYGLKRLPVYDGEQGIITAGNRTTVAIAYLHRQDKTKPPRGVSVVDDEWHIPYVTGIDADSLEEAVAYTIDDNNVVLDRGDFQPKQVAKIWDERYLSVLTSLAEVGTHPVTVDGDDLDLLLEYYDKQAETATEGADSPAVADLSDLAIGLGSTVHFGPHKLFVARPTISSYSILLNGSIDLLYVRLPSMGLDEAELSAMHADILSGAYYAATVAVNVSDTRREDGTVLSWYYGAAMRLAIMGCTPHWRMLLSDADGLFNELTYFKNGQFSSPLLDGPAKRAATLNAFLVALVAVADPTFTFATNDLDPALLWNVAFGGGTYYGISSNIFEVKQLLRVWSKERGLDSIIVINPDEEE